MLIGLQSYDLQTALTEDYDIPVNNLIYDEKFWCTTDCKRSHFLIECFTNLGYKLHYYRRFLQPISFLPYRSRFFKHQLLFAVTVSRPRSATKSALSLVVPQFSAVKRKYLSVKAFWFSSFEQALSFCDVLIF